MSELATKEAINRVVDPTLAGLLGPAEDVVQGLKGLGMTFRPYKYEGYREYNLNAFFPNAFSYGQAEAALRVAPTALRFIDGLNGEDVVPITPADIANSIDDMHRIEPASTQKAYELVKDRPDGDLVHKVVMAGATSIEARDKVNEKLDKKAAPYTGLLAGFTGEGGARDQFVADVHAGLSYIEKRAREHRESLSGKKKLGNIGAADVAFGIEDITRRVLGGDEALREQMPLVASLVQKAVEQGAIKPANTYVKFESKLGRLKLRVAAATIIRMLNDALPEELQNKQLEVRAQHCLARFERNKAKLEGLHTYGGQVLRGLHGLLPTGPDQGILELENRVRRAFPVRAVGRAVVPVDWHAYEAELAEAAQTEARLALAQ